MADDKDPSGDIAGGPDTNRRLALDAVGDWSKALIGLSTGAVVLSVTFLEQFYQGDALSLLVTAWALFIASIFLGLLVAGQRIDQLAKSNFTVRRGRLELFSLLQYLTFFVAVVVFFAFALNNVSAIDIDSVNDQPVPANLSPTATPVTPP